MSKIRNSEPIRTYIDSLTSRLLASMGESCVDGIGTAIAEG